VRSPFKKRQDDRERGMAEALAAAIDDCERRVAIATAKAIEAEGVVDIALDALGSGTKIRVESRAHTYLGGLGEDFDEFALIETSRIENVRNAHNRYLRRQGRDPEAMDVEAVTKAMEERHPVLRGLADYAGGVRPNTHRREGGSILD
jgi:hypothetical protein